MAPNPAATSRPIDIARARPRPMLSVAIAITRRGESLYRYAERSEERRWTGTVDATSVDSALVDFIGRIRDACDAERIRFVAQVSPPRSMLWALRDEVALLMPGVWIDRPKLSDEALVRKACAALREATAPPPPAWVATDGSVRGRITGYGWLASSGEYGLQGFRHSTKLIGPEVVLVAELRAIGMAVQKLRGREHHGAE